MPRDYDAGELIHDALAELRAADSLDVSASDRADHIAVAAVVARLAQAAATLEAGRLQSQALIFVNTPKPEP